MLNDFNGACRIKALKTFIAVGQGSLKQFNALALCFWQAVHLEALLSDLQCAMGYIYTNQPLERLVSQ